MTYYGYEFVRESDLTHHGILGQKWGIRRFQNLDGTLTRAGRARKQSQDDRSMDRAVRFIAKRGDYGVYMAVADKGYDMKQVKNGIYTSGRIAYRKSSVERS